MVAAYVTGALAVVSYGAAVRQWPVPLSGGRVQDPRAEETETAGPGTAIFSGDAYASAETGGVAIAQAGTVHVVRDPGDPPQPGRSRR
jgi:hypothetical protein